MENVNLKKHPCLYIYIKHSTLHSVLCKLYAINSNQEQSQSANHNLLPNCEFDVNT